MTTPRATAPGDPLRPRSFRAVNLMPGAVEIECETCHVRLRGLTAASVMGQWKGHRCGQ